MQWILGFSYLMHCRLREKMVAKQNLKKRSFNYYFRKGEERNVQKTISF